MHTRLYCHLIWTTAGREPIIDRVVAEFLCRLFRGIARKERAEVLAVGIVSTHVHVLVRFHPTSSISAVVKRLKGASSAVARIEGVGGGGRLLRWAKGYTAHTVGQRQVEVVRRYLVAQPGHHPSEAIVDWSGDVATAEDLSGALPPFRSPAG